MSDACRRRLRAGPIRIAGIAAAVLLVLLGGGVAPVAARTLYVLPGDDPRLFVSVHHPAWRALNDELVDFGVEIEPDMRFITLSHALKMAVPGDEILLFPGLYDQNKASDLIRFARDGEPDAPIMLRAIGAGVDIRAAAAPPAAPRYLVDESDGGLSLLEVPRFDKGSYCVQILNRRGIVLDGLSGSNCGSALIGIRNSSYITIRNLDTQGLHVVIYAEGPDGRGRPRCGSSHGRRANGAHRYSRNRSGGENHFMKGATLHSVYAQQKNR